MNHNLKNIYIGKTKIIITKPHGEIFKNEWFVSFYDPKWWLMTSINCTRNDLINEIKKLRDKEIKLTYRKGSLYRFGYTRV